MSRLNSLSKVHTASNRLLESECKCLICRIAIDRLGYRLKTNNPSKSQWLTIQCGSISFLLFLQGKKFSSLFNSLGIFAGGNAVLRGLRISPKEDRTQRSCRLCTESASVITCSFVWCLKTPRASSFFFRRIFVNSWDGSATVCSWAHFWITTVPCIQSLRGWKCKVLICFQGDHRQITDPLWVSFDA